MTKDEIHGLLQRSKELLQEFTLDGHPMVCHISSPIDNGSDLSDFIDAFHYWRGERE